MVKSSTQLALSLRAQKKKSNQLSEFFYFRKSRSTLQQRFSKRRLPVASVRISTPSFSCTTVFDKSVFGAFKISLPQPNLKPIFTITNHMKKLRGYLEHWWCCRKHRRNKIKLTHQRQKKFLLKRHTLQECPILTLDFLFNMK